MEGKLIFDRDNQYTLIVNDNIFSSTNAFRIAENEYWLCINNCEAIKRGYDLDEITSEKYGFPMFEPTNSVIGSFELKCRAKGFQEGFKMRDEMLSDKKFSEKDVRKIIHWSTLDRDVRLSEEELFQSLQQNEWDVEIIMKDNFESDGIEIVNIPKPKLDSKGKLILKLKS